MSDIGAGRDRPGRGPFARSAEGGGKGGSGAVSTNAGAASSGVSSGSSRSGGSSIASGTATGGGISASADASLSGSSDGAAASGAGSGAAGATGAGAGAIGVGGGGAAPGASGSRSGAISRARWSARRCKVACQRAPLRGRPGSSSSGQGCRPCSRAASWLLPCSARSSIAGTACRRSGWIRGMMALPASARKRRSSPTQPSLVIYSGVSTGSSQESVSASSRGARRRWAR